MAKRAGIPIHSCGPMILPASPRRIFLLIGVRTFTLRLRALTPEAWRLAVQARPVFGVGPDAEQAAPSVRVLGVRVRSGTPVGLVPERQPMRQGTMMPRRMYPAP